MNRLREIRDQKDVTQFDLAVKAGTTPRTVARIEAGANCEMKTARRLADALGVRVDDIFPSSIDADSAA